MEEENEGALQGRAKSGGREKIFLGSLAGGPSSSYCPSPSGGRAFFGISWGSVQGVERSLYGAQVGWKEASREAITRATRFLRTADCHRWLPDWVTAWWRRTEGMREDWHSRGRETGLADSTRKQPARGVSEAYGGQARSRVVKQPSDEAERTSKRAGEHVWRSCSFL